ncbi:MAG: hypothetical protein IKU52_00010 [Clostridia bacterium]|nr:hypothetical protein [Clostridia bacterium]
MKRFLSIFLILATFLSLISCSNGKALDGEIEKKIEEDGEYNILILGDDLLETSKSYEYFEKLCTINQKEIVLDYKTIEDARLYTFAELCETDEEFAQTVAKAEVIIFEEGTAETATTVESLENILKYANSPITVNISLYGYPRWMHRDIFKDVFRDMKYADANKYISKIIASEEDVLGFEHLYQEDRIHPNELNGYLTAIIIYCEVFNANPKRMTFEGFEYDEGLLGCVPQEWQGREDELWKKLNMMLVELM